MIYPSVDKRKREIEERGKGPERKRQIERQNQREREIEREYMCVIEREKEREISKSVPMDRDIANPIIVNSASRYTLALRPGSGAGDTNPPHCLIRAISSASSGL